jgi:hypothetical protein
LFAQDSLNDPQFVATRQREVAASAHRHRRQDHQGLLAVAGLEDLSVPVSGLVVLAPDLDLHPVVGREPVDLASQGNERSPEFDMPIRLPDALWSQIGRFLFD